MSTSFVTVPYSFRGAQNSRITHFVADFRRGVIYATKYRRNEEYCGYEKCGIFLRGRGVSGAMY